MKAHYISAEEFDILTEEELKWIDDVYQYEQFIIEQNDLERSKETI
jgi:hypothetical protein